MAQEISKEKAKKLIDESSEGFLMVFRMEPKKVLGKIPIEDREYDYQLNTYRFGEND